MERWWEHAVVSRWVVERERRCGGAGRKEDEALAMPILKWKTMEMK